MVGGRWLFGRGDVVNSTNVVLPCSAGEALGVLPNPAVLESLGLQRIPVDEGGTSSQAAASKTLGEAVVKGPTAAPLVKKGPCIAIRESRLPK